LAEAVKSDMNLQSRFGSVLTPQSAAMAAMSGGGGGGGRMDPNNADGAAVTDGGGGWKSLFMVEEGYEGKFQGGVSGGGFPSARTVSIEHRYDSSGRVG